MPITPPSPLPPDGTGRLLGHLYFVGGVAALAAAGGLLLVGTAATRAARLLLRGGDHLRDQALLRFSLTHPLATVLLRVRDGVTPAEQRN